MSRACRLLFLSQRSEGEAPRNADVVVASDDGIPLGWILAFGGRNFWAPADQVSDRGGSSAERNRYETPLDVADARLNTAIDALRDCPHLWVWMSPVELLHRRIQARGKKGFLHLDAPWAFDEAGGRRERLYQAISLAENLVNLAAADRLVDIRRVVPALDEFCPFVPRCEQADHDRFAALRIAGADDELSRLAIAVVGAPAAERDRFLSLVRDRCAEPFALRQSLPPYPKPPAAATAVAAVPPAESAAKGGGFMERLKGLVRRKT